MSTTPPAGWYPDPGDGSQQRYWDGANWTASTQPAGYGQASEPMGAYAQQSAGSQAMGYGATTYAPDPNSIGSALSVVRGAFWRLLGLVAIAVGASFLVGIAAALLTAGTVSDVVSSGECYQTFGGEIVCEGGDPNFGGLILIGILFPILYGGIGLLGLWIFAAMVRVVRGEQTGDHATVGMALRQTWPRAWRFIALGLAVGVALGVLFLISALLGNVSTALGLLMLFVVGLVALAAYVVLAGLYAWLLSPTSDEM